MTQAHKTPGAIVVLRDDEMNELFAEMVPDWRNHPFEVISDRGAGHVHVRSISHPEIDLDGWHDDRFQTYKGPDLKELQARVKR